MPLTNPEKPPTWQTLSPAAKWNVVKTVQFTKRDNIVFGRGQVVEAGTNSIVLLDTVLTLPTGFRPSVNLTGFVCDPAGAFGARLDIGTDGTIKIFWDSTRGYPGFLGNSIYVNFENIQFPLW